MPIRRKSPRFVAHVRKPKCTRRSAAIVSAAAPSNFIRSACGMRSLTVAAVIMNRTSIGGGCCPRAGGVRAASTMLTRILERHIGGACLRNAYLLRDYQRDVSKAVARYDAQVRCGTAHEIGSELHRWVIEELQVRCLCIGRYACVRE